MTESIRLVMVDNEGTIYRDKARELSETLCMKGEEDIDAVVAELVKLYAKNKRQDQ